MSDSTYNTWFAFRLCNGHGSNAGKWAVGFQRKTGGEVHIAQRPSGGTAAFKTRDGACSHADHLNNIGATP